jgi:SAM-dependent methyltransferase
MGSRHVHSGGEDAMSADKAQRIRPWDYTQCRDHYRELKLAEHFEASPKILDVGFGKERRSTLALRAIFPRSEIVAIDSNLNYCKQAIESSEDADKARFLFSDVDLLDIPGGQTYDLVVFCMTLFCLQNPLRAIGTITSRALTNNGIVLITQRTDPVMRALCDLPPIESEGERDRLNGYSAYRIRNFWKNINARAASNNLLLVYPWRFRLVCDLDPVVSSVGDIGYEDVTMGDIVRKGNVTMRYPEEVKQSGDYPPLGDQEHLETYGSVLGGPIGSMSEPQYSRMKWAWHQFKENRVEWPRVVDETAPLSIQSVSLSSRLFKLTKTVGVESEHPFRTFTAPLKILPNTWRCRREDLPVEAKNAVRSWITKRKLEDSVIGFYLLSPHGVSGQQENPAPLALYEDPSGVQPIQGSLDELQLSSFLERRESNSTVIQFYRIGSKQLWDKDTAASTFLVEAADPVQMLAFPIFLSEDENNDLEEIRKRLTEMEKPLQMRNSSTDVELQAVARYLRKRGEWMRDNVAYGIYYYYRHNPPVDNRPVSRGASMLVTETLPIEVTLEFLVLAEEVILAKKPVERAFSFVIFRIILAVTCWSKDRTVLKSSSPN